MRMWCIKTLDEFVAGDFSMGCYKEDQHGYVEDNYGQKRLIADLKQCKTLYSLLEVKEV